MTERDKDVDAALGLAGVWAGWKLGGSKAGSGIVWLLFAIALVGWLVQQHVKHPVGWGIVWIIGITGYLGTSAYNEAHPAPEIPPPYLTAEARAEWDCLHKVDPQYERHHYGPAAKAQRAEVEAQAAMCTGLAYRQR
jgi:hypothetical protein